MGLNYFSVSKFMICILGELMPRKLFSGIITLIFNSCIEFEVKTICEITMGPFKIIAFEFNILHLYSMRCIAFKFKEGSKI